MYIYIYTYYIYIYIYMHIIAYMCIYIHKHAMIFKDVDYACADNHRIYIYTNKYKGW